METTTLTNPLEIGTVTKDPFMSMDDLVKRENKSGIMVRAKQDDIQIEMRDVDRDNLEVEFIISSSRRDDYGTRFDPRGMDMSQFRKNPVVLYRHMRDGGIYTLPIANGMPETMKIDDQNRIHMNARFTSEETFPFGFQVYKLIRDEFLHMSSIGAQIMEAKEMKEANGETTVLFTSWKLFEFSVVPIGANDDALVVSRDMEDSVQLEDAKRVYAGMCIEKNEEQEQKKEKSFNVSVVRDDQGVGIVNVQCDEELFLCVQGVDIPETDQQRVHREYYEESQPVLKLYRSLMEKLYKRMGLQPYENEVRSVQTITKLILSPTAPNGASNQPAAAGTQRSKPPVGTRQPTAQELKDLSAELARKVEQRKREALKQGMPLSKVERMIPEWTQEAINSVFSSNS